MTQLRINTVFALIGFGNRHMCTYCQYPLIHQTYGVPFMQSGTAHAKDSSPL